MVFTITPHTEADATILACKGRLVMGPAVDIFTDTVNGAAPGKIVLDLSQMPYLDQAGLNAMEATRKTVTIAGGELQLRGLVPAVKKVFTERGLYETFKCHDDAPPPVAEFPLIFNTSGAHLFRSDLTFRRPSGSSARKQTL